MFIIVFNALALQSDREAIMKVIIGLLVLDKTVLLVYTSKRLMNKLSKVVEYTKRMSCMSLISGVLCTIFYPC